MSSQFTQKDHLALRSRPDYKELLEEAQHLVQRARPGAGPEETLELAEEGALVALAISERLDARGQDWGLPEAEPGIYTNPNSSPHAESVAAPVKKDFDRHR